MTNIIILTYDWSSGILENAPCKVEILGKEIKVVLHTLKKMEFNFNSISQK